jgi:competence protein ComEA
LEPETSDGEKDLRLPAVVGQAAAHQDYRPTKGEPEMKKAHAIFLGLFALVAALVAAPVFAAEQDQTAKATSSELRVDINAADVNRLTELPGIGEKVAARIVAYRKENGRFQKIEEIMNVRGIGEKTFVKLRKHLTVGGESNKSPSGKKKS